VELGGLRRGGSRARAHPSSRRRGGELLRFGVSKKGKEKGMGQSSGSASP
jgi:hypothetical protein